MRVYVLETPPFARTHVTYTWQCVHVCVRIAIGVRRVSSVFSLSCRRAAAATTTITATATTATTTTACTGSPHQKAEARRLLTNNLQRWCRRGASPQQHRHVASSRITSTALALSWCNHSVTAAATTPTAQLLQQQQQPPPRPPPTPPATTTTKSVTSTATATASQPANNRDGISQAN